MPMVGKKKFAYSKKGKSDEKKYAKKTNKKTKKKYQEYYVIRKTKRK